MADPTPLYGSMHAQPPCHHYYYNIIFNHFKRASHREMSDSLPLWKTQTHTCKVLGSLELHAFNPPVFLVPHCEVLTRIFFPVVMPSSRCIFFLATLTTTNALKHVSVRRVKSIIALEFGRYVRLRWEEGGGQSMLGLCAEWFHKWGGVVQR